MRTLPTQTELRTKITTMTKDEMKSLRDLMENNWTENLSQLMQILSLGCINKFKTTLVNL